MTHCDWPCALISSILLLFRGQNMFKVFCWVFVGMGAAGMWISSLPPDFPQLKQADGTDIWGGQCNTYQIAFGAACLFVLPNSCAGGGFSACIGICAYTCTPVNSYQGGNAFYISVIPGRCPVANQNTCTYGFLGCYCTAPIPVPCAAPPNVFNADCLQMARRDGLFPPLKLAVTW